MFQFRPVFFLIFWSSLTTVRKDNTNAKSFLLGRDGCVQTVRDKLTCLATWCCALERKLTENNLNSYLCFWLFLGKAQYSSGGRYECKVFRSWPRRSCKRKILVNLPVRLSAVAQNTLTENRSDTGTDLHFLQLLKSQAVRKFGTTAGSSHFGSRTSLVSWCWLSSVH